MNKEKNSGITLIALVITIVVLVILVGVSVTTAVNTGLIGNTKTAVNDYNKKQKQEQFDIEKIAGTLDVYSMDEVKAGEYTGTSNKKYVDGNKTAYIPAGFTVSNVPGETSIDGGLVIYSGNHSTVSDMSTIQTTANQYVWIPVENPSDMYGTDKDGNKLGKLYDFGNSTDGYATSPDDSTALNWTETNGVMSWTSPTGYREPDYLATTSWADDSKYNKDASGNKIITEKGIQDKFNKMIISIEIYKGFYIGRYELTGTTTKPTVVKLKTPLTTATSYTVNSNLRGYGLYSMCEKLEEGNNDAKGKVTTTMIWGIQWDQAIKKSLIATTDATTGESDFLINAGKYGVYGKSNSTISGTKTSAYNIFDMSGNLRDATLEANNTYHRVWRGGSAYDNASYYPASIRYNMDPGTYVNTIGTRPQLYL